MKAVNYIVHGLKYFLKLLLLLVLIYLILFLFGQAKVSAGQFAMELFTTTRGILLFVALFALAMFYPLFGFVRRTVAADIVEDRDRIINAFHASGYMMKEMEEGKRMVFRAASVMKKITMVWDDKITVTADGGHIILEGIRKETVQAEFRINTYMQNKANEGRE